MFKLLMTTLFAGLPLALMAQQAPVQVTRAEWGADRTWVDVTQRVQAVIDSGRSSFRVDGEALGDDPVPGTPKTLRVRTRTQAGRTQSFEYRDFETVELRTWGILPGSRGQWSRDPRDRMRSGGSQSGDLRILSAQYGDGRRQSDVTAMLNNAIQGGNTLSLQAINQNLGGDPAPAVVKRLTVQYQWQGQTYNVTVPENGWLRLPETGGAFGTPSNIGLRIVQATYGGGGRVLDVTGRLQSLIQGDRLSIRASNDAMGGDPARGADKKLTVIYEWQGARYQAEVNEDNSLALPRSGDQVLSSATPSSPYNLGGGTPTSSTSINAGRYFDSTDQIWKMNGDGVCFYRQPYFKGDATCVASGQELTAVPDGNVQFLSVRFFGRTRQVQVWSQPSFSGRGGRFLRDETDLSRSSGAASFGGSMTAIGSARVN